MLYKKKKALIFGISGQDGTYLTRLLIKKNYTIFGTSRKKISKVNNFIKIKIKKKIKIFKVDPQKIKEVLRAIRISKCNEIYYFSGISSVSYSFSHSEETIRSNTLGFLNILESVRLINKKIKIYNALTGECFGSSNEAFDENSNFNPQSPYALSKVINAYLAINYRNNLGIHVVNGFSFNHDSSLRPDHFILKKIANYIKNKKPLRKLEVGNINISRDWSWAPEHVDFIYKIMQLKKSDDYIIGTGKSVRLKNIIYYFFRKFNIKKSMLVINKKYIRKHDIINSKSNPKKLKKIFKKLPKTDVFDLVNNLVNEKFL